MLIDFDAYTEWNPFVVSARRDGNRLDIIINPPDEKPQKFSPVILNIVENTELRWVGKVGSEYLFRGEHSFELKEIESGKTRLLHCEVFTGFLTCLVSASQRANIQRGFELMNQALSERVKMVATFITS